MFVSESSIFGSSMMKIRICGAEGRDLALDVNPDYTVDKLKVLAVSQLLDPTESAKISLYHKMVLVRTGRQLTEENTLLHEGVIEGDEILLLHRRIPPTTFNTSGTKKDDESLSITLDMIKKVTEHVRPVNQDNTHSEDTGNIDFQAELRKILISLIEAAQKILALNPEAAKILQDAELFMEEQESGPKIDEVALKQLLDMGFPETRATKALLLNKMDATQATQWLIEHEEDDDIDIPLPNQPKPTARKTTAPSVCSSDSSQPEKPSNNNFPILKGPRKVSSMLESFRAFRRRQFKPNPRALKHLIDMGFNETDSIDALRITGNKEESACEWLLSSSRKIPDDDLEEGLDPNSPLYTAIMSNAVVQLGLSNPRSLLAFLHMLENPSNTQQWLNDPDTGPMLVQISRIYHAEKHAPENALDFRS